MMEHVEKKIVERKAQMRNINEKIKAQIKLNQQQSRKLLKAIVAKSTTRARELQEIQEYNSRINELKKINMKLGGYSATFGMKPKQSHLEDVVKKVLRPGREMTVAQVEAAVLVTGYQTKQIAWFRATIGKALRSIKGVKMVAGKKGTYVYTPVKKVHHSHGYQAA